MGCGVKKKDQLGFGCECLYTHNNETYRLTIDGDCNIWRKLIDCGFSLVDEGEADLLNSEYIKMSEK